MRFEVIFWFFIAAAAAAAPIPFIKEYTVDRRLRWIILSFFSYTVLIFSYYRLLPNRDVVIVYPLLKVLSILLVVSAGILVFGNKINMTSAVGILLGVVSLYLLSSQI